MLGMWEEFGKLEQLGDQPEAESYVLRLLQP